MFSVFFVLVLSFFRFLFNYCDIENMFICLVSTISLVSLMFPFSLYPSLDIVMTKQKEMASSKCLGQ